MTPTSMQPASGAGPFLAPPVSWIDPEAPVPVDTRPGARVDPPVGSTGAAVPPASAADAAVPPARYGPVGRLVRGRPGAPAWERPTLLALLAATAVLYLWGLGASGWANAFYAAAVQAGSHSWKAFFFGSFDSSNFITVDKTPASLWVMDISARLFGVNAWSLLVPQALEGVAAVGVLYATVRRWFPTAAALLAAVVLALTPVAVLMFRFDNPDALMVLLLTVAAYATVRALERAGTGWLALAGALVGFGFLAKMLQAVLVVPALALAYLVAAPTRLRRRLWQLAVAGLAMIAAAGWWVAIVQLVPAAARPYIGGSQHNSILELALGYNGFGRITGNEVGSVGGGTRGPLTGAGRGFWGQTGWGRLFGTEMGGQIAWLLPAALVMLVAGLWLAGRAARTDRARAAYLLWGGWLLGTALTFSFMRGIIHPYYTVQLAPAVAALVGMGATAPYARRRHAAAAVTLALTTALTAWWAYTLLGRSPSWLPWLRGLLLAAGVLAAIGLPVPVLAGRARFAGRVTAVAAGAALAAVLAGPTAYAVDTAATPHQGAIPSAGPAVATGRGPGRFGGLRGGAGGNQFRRRSALGQVPGGFGQFPGGFGQFPGGAGQLPGGSGQVPGGASQFPGGTGQFPGGGLQPGAGGRGTAGGLLGAGTPGAEAVAALRRDAGRYSWVAAAVGANNAAGYQLASGEPVMAIGGFNGSDPAPTLAEFQRYVAAHRIHYFIGGGMRGGGGGGTGEQIAAWVAENFTATTIGGSTVYDLSAGA